MFCNLRYAVVCTVGTPAERAARLECGSPRLADDWADALERSNPDSIYAVLDVDYPKNQKASGRACC